MATATFLAFCLATVLGGSAAPFPVGADQDLQTPQVHRVQDGETLSSIAAIHFGNPHLWPALYRANRDQIRDPSRLYPGQTLSIPLTSSTLAPGEGERRGRPADEPARR